VPPAIKREGDTLLLDALARDVEFQSVMRPAQRTAMRPYSKC
jgi:hypothetical protein